MLRAFLVLAACALIARADDLNVVIGGDGRWDSHQPRPSMDKDGINAKILQELVSATIKEHADVFVFTGDLVGGHNGLDEFEQQLHAWMGYVQPLLDHGVRVLPVRGNHELGRDSAKRTQLYREIVAKPCNVPTNGPAGEEMLTYSLQVGDTLFVGLDQFGGDRVAVNLPWFEDLMAKNHAVHVIPFAHEMAFTAGHHTDHMGGKGGDVEGRDRFWSDLIRFKVRWFFAGHDHLYDRMTVASREGGDAVEQIVAGTSGAPPYPTTGCFPGPKEAPEPGADKWKAEQEFHLSGTYGYVLVKIAGSSASLVYKARTLEGDYAGVDQWSYSR
jgi:hypothetical protein